jgi:hypothetical protein
MFIFEYSCGSVRDAEQRVEKIRVRPRGHDLVRERREEEVD